MDQPEPTWTSKNQYEPIRTKDKQQIWTNQYLSGPAMTYLDITGLIKINHRPVITKPNQFGPIRAHLYQLGHIFNNRHSFATIRTQPNYVGLICTHFLFSGPILTKRYLFASIRTNLDHPGPVWSSPDKN